MACAVHVVLSAMMTKEGREMCNEWWNVSGTSLDSSIHIGLSGGGVGGECEGLQYFLQYLSSIVSDR